jgi:hypothetical protein
MSGYMPASVTVGDRVRVVTEGVVTHSSMSSFDVGQCGTFFDYQQNPNGKFAVEILPPPVRVGDVATRAVLDALPTGSVIRTRLGSVGKLYVYLGERRWEFTGMKDPYDSETVATFAGAAVIFIPDPQ